MLMKLLRRLGVKVVIFRLSHDVLNATTSIAGIISKCKRSKVMTSADQRDLMNQVARIEQAICFVRKINRGDV